MDDDAGGGGGSGDELLNVSKFNNGVDRVRNADNDDKSSLFCTRIFELNFGALLLTGGGFVFAFVASAASVDDSALISSVAIGSVSKSASVFAVAAAASVVVLCSDGNSSFKFGRSSFLCLYAGGRNVGNDESVAIDDTAMDVVTAVGAAVAAVDNGTCIIFFGMKLLKRFMPGGLGGVADAVDGEMVGFFAFSSALKCSG